jgi:hypothetical protein
VTDHRTAPAPRPRPLITEVIYKAGPALFGDDWIGDLTQKEIALIKAHGPQRGKGADGSIETCPQKYRRALDRALGRELRSKAQCGTVFDWLQEHGFVTSTSRSCDAVALSRALERRRVMQTATAAGKGRGQGRRADKTPAAVDKILSALGRSLAFSKFCEMTDVEIRQRFDLSSRAVARSARKQIISGRSK